MAFVGHHQNVVLTVTARSGHAFGQHDHGFDGYDHAGFEHGFDIFTEFQTGFAPVVVRQNTKGVSVTKGAVLQQAVLFINFVQLMRDVAAAHTWLDQLLTFFVHPNIHFPQFQGCSINLAKEQRAF